jgi:hypothetical protein
MAQIKAAKIYLNRRYPILKIEGRGLDMEFDTDIRAYVFDRGFLPFPVGGKHPLYNKENFELVGEKRMKGIFKDIQIHRAVKIFFERVQKNGLRAQEYTDEELAEING